MPLASEASGSLGNSQRSAGSAGSRDRDCDDAMSDAPTQPDTATTTPAECTLPSILIDYELIDAYLSEIGAPDAIAAALDRIACLAQHAQGIQNAIQQLQKAVQKQAQPAPSAAPANTQHTYAAAARRGVAQPPISTYKPVPTRHKREIVVARGNESNIQKIRTYKEIVEQLNGKGMAGEVIAVRKLPSGDVVLAMENEQARTSWLTNQSWLSTFGAGARVKKREFAVIAHGIRVNQVQGQGQAIEEIYKQNPKLRGSVEILRVAFAKKLLRSGRTTGPLIISVAEPEQANCLIDAGLVWHHELHDCEPFDGNCVVTQCFKCYQYGHVARVCQNLLRCGCCAALGHVANDCLRKDDKSKHRCINCRGKHQSWARECPERAKRTTAARQAYDERPSRFQSLATLAPAAAPILAPAAPASATPAIAQAKCSYQQPTVEDEEQEQWTQVGNRRTTSPPTGPPEKRRKGPGRPLGSTKAAKNTKDIRDVFKGLYE